MNKGYKREPQKNQLSRRTFIKGMAATTAASGMLLSTSLFKAGTATAAEGVFTNEAGETVVKSFCRSGCANSCFHNVHLRNGQVVRTSMAPLPDERFNRICIRGISHPQRIHHPDRLKYPMKRAGERGEGKWERITWDEAMNIIGPKFREIREQYGPNAIGVASGYGFNALLSGIWGAMRFQSGIEATFVGYSADFSGEYGFLKVVGPGVDYVQGNDFADMMNAKTIFIWAANPAVTMIQAWHFIVEAQENGQRSLPTL